MSANKSQADLLREWISQKLDEKYDYSSSSNCKSDIKEFCKQYKDRKYLEKSVRPNHSKILNEQLKNRGIEPASIGKKSKLKFNSELNATITPNPVSGKVDTTKPEQKTETKQLIGKDGKPIQTIQAPAPHNYEHFDAEGVGATFQAFVMMIRMGIPEMEGLTPEEKVSLGKMWLPAFQRYLTENWAYIGIPLLATLGLFIPKIVTARKKHKEKELSKEKNKLTEKATKEEKERHANKKFVCPYCRENFSEIELQNHKPNCKEKPKYGV